MAALTPVKVEEPEAEVPAAAAAVEAVEPDEPAEEDVKDEPDDWAWWDPGEWEEIEEEEGNWWDAPEVKTENVAASSVAGQDVPTDQHVATDQHVPTDQQASYVPQAQDYNQWQTSYESQNHNHWQTANSDPQNNQWQSSHSNAEPAIPWRPKDKGKGYGSYDRHKGFNKGKQKSRRYPHWAYRGWQDRQRQAGKNGMKGKVDDHGGVYTAQGYRDRDGNEWEFLGHSIQ